MSYISLIWVHGLLPADGGRWLVEGLFGDKIWRRCEAEKTRPLWKDKERFVGEDNCDFWPFYCFNSQFSGQKMWSWYDTFSTNVNLGRIWGLQKGWLLTLHPGDWNLSIGCIKCWIADEKQKTSEILMAVHPVFAGMLDDVWTKLVNWRHHCRHLFFII